VTRLAAADRKTVRRYVEAAQAAGLDRDEGGPGQLCDELLGAVIAAVSPGPAAGHRGVLGDGRGAPRADQHLDRAGSDADQGPRAARAPRGSGAVSHAAPLRGRRQLVESVNDTLKGQLDLELHGARSIAGVGARIAQRLLAMTAAIWHNRATGQPLTRSLIAYHH
jgi:hypothetical protein